MIEVIDSHKTSLLLKIQIEKYGGVNKLSAESGIGIDTIRGWIGKDATPKIDNLVTISNLMNCQIKDLLVTKFVDLPQKNNIRHTKEYRVWKAMKGRCYLKCRANHGYYQTDGIKVCERWLHSFENFLEDMGHMPAPNYSIERIDNMKDYCPENCKWIPQNEQQKNRRNNVMLEYGGKTYTLSELAIKVGIKPATMHLRIVKNGYSVEEAIKYKRTPFIDYAGRHLLPKQWCKFLGVDYQDAIEWKKENKAGFQEMVEHFANEKLREGDC